MEAHGGRFRGGGRRLPGVVGAGVGRGGSRGRRGVLGVGVRGSVHLDVSHQIGLLKYLQGLVNPFFPLVIFSIVSVVKRKDYSFLTPRYEGKCRFLRHVLMELVSQYAELLLATDRGWNYCQRR